MRVTNMNRPGGGATAFCRFSGWRAWWSTGGAEVIAEGPGALVAVFLFTFLPPVLAHAGLATTDMAVTAFMGAAFLAGSELDGAARNRSGQSCARSGRGRRNSLEVLVSGILSCERLSGAGLVLAVLEDHRRPRWCLMSEGQGSHSGSGDSGGMPGHVGRLPFLGGKATDAASMVAPAPELFQGIQAVAQHNQEGHSTYLLGDRSKTGFLLFSR